MTRILFVCLGNICRSPTAEAVMRGKLCARQIEHLVTCDSAGTASYHLGKAPDHRATRAATSRGYDMTALRARQVQADDFENFDLILAMDQSNLAELRLRAGPLFQHKLRLLLDYADGDQQEVPDPYYGDGEGFDRVLDLVESACDGLVNSVLGHTAK